MYFVSTSPREGLEPTTQWLTVTCSTNWATSEWYCLEMIGIVYVFARDFQYKMHFFVLIYIIYRGQGSNLHTFRHLVLSQACLPFHHPGMGDFVSGVLYCILGR